MVKWVMQNSDKDPTSIAHLLANTKRRSALLSALQHLRIERIAPGDCIVLQGSMPRAEDGHFTVLNGECEALHFSEGSVPLLNLQTSMALRNWDECRDLLARADILARFPCGSVSMNRLL